MWTFLASLGSHLDLLWSSKSESAAQDASDWLTLPCANTNEMVPVEVLMYEPKSLCFSKVADFCALFNPFANVS